MNGIFRIFIEKDSLWNSTINYLLFVFFDPSPPSTACFDFCQFNGFFRYKGKGGIVMIRAKTKPAARM